MTNRSTAKRHASKGLPANSSALNTLATNPLFAPGGNRRYLLIALVAAFLGLLVVGQLRGQSASPALSNLSAQELTLLIANLNARNDELRNEIATLQQQSTTLEATTSGGQTTVDQLKADLARIRAWSGATGLTGQGVEIRVSGPIGSDAIEDILNELGNAGAEAIAVEDVRVVPGIVVAGAPGSLSVENTILGDPLVIRAIGSPEILVGTLTRAGGVISQVGVSYPDARINVTPLTSIAIPASDRTLAPSHGQPRL
jgi:uncharacterized protein YlxW (UPF0749 family)